MIEIINRQRKVPVDTDGLEDFCLDAAGVVEETDGRGFTVVFVSDSRISALNAEYRGKRGPTDVLSFPFGGEEFEDGGYLGDIVISAETALRQSEENGLEAGIEIRQLILHGILHLAGFDHETDDGTMNRLELRYRKRLGIEG